MGRGLFANKVRTLTFRIWVKATAEPLIRYCMTKRTCKSISNNASPKRIHFAIVRRRSGHDGLIFDSTSVRALFIPWVAALAGWVPLMWKVAGSIPGRGCNDLWCTVHEALRGYNSCGWGVTASQLDLPSLTPLFVAGCNRLQLGVAHWVTSVALPQVVVIDPTNSGGRLSSWGLLAIEDFTFPDHYVTPLDGSNQNCSAFICA